MSLCRSLYTELRLDFEKYYEFKELIEAYVKPICNKILIFVPAGQYTTLTFRTNSQLACGHYQIVQ